MTYLMLECVRHFRVLRQSAHSRFSEFFRADYAVHAPCGTRIKICGDECHRACSRQCDVVRRPTTLTRSTKVREGRPRHRCDLCGLMRPTNALRRKMMTLCTHKEQTTNDGQWCDADKTRGTVNQPAHGIPVDHLHVQLPNNRLHRTRTITLTIDIYSRRGKLARKSFTRSRCVVRAKHT